MNYSDSPEALLPTHTSLHGAQCASCKHANICGARRLATSGGDMSAPPPSVCVRSLRRTRAVSLTPFLRMPPHSTSTSPNQIFWRGTSAIFYYSTRFLSLHYVWFSVYRLIPDARTPDLENATTSGRSCWTETVQKMNRVWTLFIMASSLIIT